VEDRACLLHVERRQSTEAILMWRWW
jgi:hypothetical protein